MRICTSHLRCRSVTCPTCARRYASRLSRRILATSPRRLVATEFTTAISSPAEFARWRIEVRNIVDYRRRECCWRREVGLWTWLSVDGRVRGVLSLGSLTEDEFVAALDWRWPTALQALTSSELRDGILAAIQPTMIYAGSDGRYQRVRSAVWPRKAAKKAAMSNSPEAAAPRIEPMPVLV
jgi:hypothetical protein